MTNHGRFVVLGIGGAFTFNVIKTLTDQEYYPLAYFQSGAEPQRQKNKFAGIELEIIQPSNELNELLETHSIPVYFQSKGDMAKRIQQLQAEFLLVACWPELLSGKVLNSVSKAALNLHPSLLPLYRGADPIQKQLDVNDFNFGVTLHLLNNQFDAGDIVLQQSIHVGKHPEKTMIEIESARKGATLFIQAINTHLYPGWILINQN